MNKTDYIVYNKLNGKYLFYNIIIFDPVTGDILFDNNDKFLHSIIPDEEAPQLIKVFHFRKDIKYYKKHISLSFLKNTTYPFVASNCSFNISQHIPSSVLAIPAPLVNYQFIGKYNVTDKYNLCINTTSKATITLYVNDETEKTIHTIECKEPKTTLTEKGKLVKNCSKHLYDKFGHSYDVVKLYELIRTLNDKEIAKDIAVLTRDMKIKEIFG